MLHIGKKFQKCLVTSRGKCYNICVQQFESVKAFRCMEVTMKKFFANIWTKRVISLLSGLYAFMACWLCYCSIFYSIEISSRISLCMLVTGISIFAVVVMLYTRKQIITRIASVVILPAMLPVVLLYFGEWGIIIPIIAAGVTILLLSGAGEGFKTAFGTIFLLLYIFGALGYFLFTSFFVTTSKTDVIASGISPSQRYRYRVVNTEDSSDGSTAVIIESNYADKHFPFVTFSLKNMDRTVYLERPITETADVQWITQSRSEITQYLNSISDTISVHLSESSLKKLGYTYDNKLALTGITAEQKIQIGHKPSDIEKIYLDTLTDEQLAIFSLARSSDGRYYIPNPPAKLYTDSKLDSGKTAYLSDITPAWREEYYTEKDDSVYLNTLTDEQLAMLGVPESGDVMIFNGKICFRYYIADLENYFDVDDRSISISLLS